VAVKFRGFSLVGLGGFAELLLKRKLSLPVSRIGSQREGAAVGQLHMSDLQLGALAGDDRPVLRPVELERLSRHKGQGHEGAAAAGLLLAQPGCLPVAGKGRHPIVRPLIAEARQIGVQLLDRALVLA